MNKALTVLVTAFIPLFAATMAPSCAGGEAAPDGSGGSGEDGSGGDNGNGSGGSSGSSTGGKGSGGSSSGSGGKGSGGSSSGSGGKGSGGTTGSSSGGTTASSGGVTGAGTGGTTSAGTAAAITFMDGFGMNASWMGYAFTGKYPETSTMTTVSPVCPTPCFKGTTACATGMVPALTSEGAFLGWNLGQTSAGGTTPTVKTSGTGLAIQLSGMPASGLRVQIGDGTTNWCAILPGLSASIPWSMFSTICYNPPDPLNKVYSVGTPITNLQVIVPGAGGSATSYNVCLVGASSY